MLKQVLAASIAAALGVSTAFAAGDMPSYRDRSSGHQQSRADLARCDSMQGAEKDQCIREEQAKLSNANRAEQSKPQNDPATRDANKGTGGTPPQ